MIVLLPILATLGGAAAGAFLGWAVCRLALALADRTEARR